MLILGQVIIFSFFFFLFAFFKQMRKLSDMFNSTNYAWDLTCVRVGNTEMNKTRPLPLSSSNLAKIVTAITWWSQSQNLNLPTSSSVIFPLHFSQRNEKWMTKSLQKMNSWNQISTYGDHPKPLFCFSY